MLVIYLSHLLRNSYDHEKSHLIKCLYKNQISTVLSDNSEHNKNTNIKTMFCLYAQL